MNKKAQGLPLNTIIIAAIALIVLVVLVAIFTGRIAIFGGQVGEAEKATCTNLGGDCVAADDCDTGGRLYGAADCETGQICCSKDKIVTA